MADLNIRDLYLTPPEAGIRECTVSGWVRTVRDSKAFGFIELNDGTCFKNLQIVLEDGHTRDFASAVKITLGSAIRVTGELVLTIMAGLAQMERATLIERTKAGLAEARRRGVHIGRPRALTDAQTELVWRLEDDGETLSSTAELLGVSTRTIDRARARRPVDQTPPAVA